MATGNVNAGFSFEDDQQELGPQGFVEITPKENDLSLTQTRVEMFTVPSLITQESIDQNSQNPPLKRKLIIPPISFHARIPSFSEVQYVRSSSEDLGTTDGIQKSVPVGNIKIYEKRTSLQDGKMLTGAERFPTNIKPKGFHPRLHKRYTVDVLDPVSLGEMFSGGLTFRVNQEESIGNLVMPLPASEVISMVTMNPDGMNHELKRLDSRVSMTSVSTIGLDRGACRICFSADNLTAKPIIVCNCVAHVHPTCLLKWLQTAELDHCEVCHHQFKVTTSIRPRKEWILPPRHSKISCLAIAQIFFFITYVSCYVWGVMKAADTFFLEIKQGRALETSGILTVIVVGTVILIVMILKVLESIIVYMLRWKRINQTTYIQIRNKYYQYQEPRYPPQQQETTLEL